MKESSLSFCRNIIFTLSLLVMGIAAPAQSLLTPSPVYRPDRLKKVVLTEAAIGTASSLGLYYLWYRKFPRSRFHFFNDNREWLQVDKVGHAMAAYNIAVFQHDLMRWCGVKPGTSIITGSATALGYMSLIEIFDGFSKHWGFSKGDMLANMIGTSLFAAQQQWWHEQRASLKFSYHGSPFARYYPAALGNNWKSRILKDYNGQTYWLSMNIKSFLPSRSTFPAWANIAAGYGGEGMIGATTNPAEIGGVPIPAFKRYRQFYIAPDIDLSRTRFSKAVTNAAYIFPLIKFPAPAVELSNGKVKGYLIYF